MAQKMTKSQTKTIKRHKVTKSTKRAESRARYFIREKAQKRGWNINHPIDGGNFLEETEITRYYPNI
ncbi:MAG: hypothetical protein LBV70_01360, partial [Candidatus Adiutrix sp.]|nr:hypothetical protein [Candidatus Adiutrix sp.]